jgi:hypothetical protein
MSPSCKLATRKTRLYYNAGWLQPTGRPPVRLPEVWREGLEWISGGAGVVRLFGRGEILFFSNTSIYGFFCFSYVYTQPLFFFLTQPPVGRKRPCQPHTQPLFMSVFNHSLLNEMVVHPYHYKSRFPLLVNSSNRKPHARRVDWGGEQVLKPLATGPGTGIIPCACNYILLPSAVFGQATPLYILLANKSLPCNSLESPFASALCVLL